MCTSIGFSIGMFEFEEGIVRTLGNMNRVIDLRMQEVKRQWR